MDRIPSIRELSQDELRTLRAVVAASFTPSRQVNPQQGARLLELGLVQCALGGLMPTPAGKIVSRM